MALRWNLAAWAFGLFAAAIAWSGSRPDWVEHPPVADPDYRYYVGRSSDAASEAQGYREAIEDAYEAAIRENFGFATRVESQDLETADADTATKRVLEESQTVELHDFERVDSFQDEALSGHVSVWVLFRYKRSAIERERQRLLTVRSKTSPTAFSEQGNASNKAHGVLEVTTDPSGAQVFIDGERWGVTPLKLYGLIGAGRHRLVLDHPYYEVVEQGLVMVPGTTVRVREILHRAHGGIRVTSEPPGARILVGGKEIGRTPTDVLEFPVGEKVMLEFRHPDAERLLQEVEVSRGEVRDIQVSLVPKPDKAISAAPSAPQSDGLGIEPKFGSGLEANRAPAESGDGDDSGIGDYFLERFGIWDWNLGFGIGFHDQTLQSAFALPFVSVDFWLEKKFFGFLGIRGGMTLDGSSSTDNTTELTGGSMRLAGVGYLIHSSTVALYGFYEVGKLAHTYTFLDNSAYTASSGMMTVHQDMKGVGGGYQGWSSTTPWGWVIEAGYYQYSSYEGMPGERSWSGRLGGIVRF